MVVHVPADPSGGKTTSGLAFRRRECDGGGPTLGLSDAGGALAFAFGPRALSRPFHKLNFLGSPLLHRAAVAGQCYSIIMDVVCGDDAVAAANAAEADPDFDDDADGSDGGGSGGGRDAHMGDAAGGSLGALAASVASLAVAC